MHEETFDPVIFWLEGGAAMYLVALSWLAAEATGVLALITRKAAVAMAAIAVSTLPLTLGVLGMVYNRGVVADALAAVSPEDRAIIEAQGNREAMRPLQLGGVLTLFTLPMGVIAFAKSARTKKPDEVKSISNSV